jgi:prepilin-type processing-associated H-X9-DG protein
MMASVGLGAPEISFSPSFDIVNAGVLLSLPALPAQGLLQHAEAQFALPNRYYRLNSIFLLLSFMALARVKSVESLRYCAPGEWGKVLGLDRVPEVRTLRQKIALLAVDKKPATWSAELCQQWMKAAPEQAGALYVDGHVRVYHGKLANLPRRYVARKTLSQRKCGLLGQRHGWTAFLLRT